MRTFRTLFSELVITDTYLAATDISAFASTRFLPHFCDPCNSSLSSLEDVSPQ